MPVKRSAYAKSAARRVTIYKAADGWRYRVQASNWRIIEASEEAFAQLRTVQKRIEKKYPGVEVVTDRG